jgi:predicted  nucleic acid-binding Zn-ribbon protein
MDIVEMKGLNSEQASRVSNLEADATRTGTLLRQAIEARDELDHAVVVSAEKLAVAEAEILRIKSERDKLQAELEAEKTKVTEMSGTLAEIEGKLTAKVKHLAQVEEDLQHTTEENTEA